MYKKFAALFFMAVTFCAIFPESSRSDELPTGYIQSPVDKSNLEEELPILRNPNAKYPVSLRDTPLPISYDMRVHSRVPSPRNQHPWGTCWAHAAIGSIETAYITQGYSNDINLSEMHLSYFVYGDPRPGKSFGLPDYDDGILGNGGNSDMAVAFLSKMGTVSESVLPYSNTSPDRLPEDYKPSGIRLQSAYYLASPSAAPDHIKRFIVETGAVQISYYNVDSSYYKGDSGTTTFYNTSGGYSTNHAVLLIGWDDNFPRENFPRDSRPKSNGAWLVRNSWGSSWYSSRYRKLVGDDGCFWMSYEQYMASAVIFIPAKSEKGLRHYGYDDLGYCSKIDSDWCANIFKAECNESFKYVGFHTAAKNASYDIYIYDLGTETPDSPVNGTLIESVKDGYAPYLGYYTVEVEGKISAGHYFSVVMKSDKPFACEDVLYWGSGNIYSDPVCNPGETYSSSDGESWRERSKNVCIKAFTVPDDSNPELKFVEINSDNFPDEVLREYLKDFDLDENGYLSSHEIEIVKSVTLPNSGLHSMKGVELLTHIVSIDISGNYLNVLDLSANTAMKSLKCYSQDASGLVLTKLGDNLYSVNLKGYISGDISRVIPESVKVSSGDVSYNSETGVAEFSFIASSVYYEYDTGWGGQTLGVTAHTRYNDENFVNIDNINFPDDKFRAFVERYDKDNDGWLSLSERNNVSQIQIINSGKMSSIKGIEFFTALKYLDCSYHKISELNISNQTALKKLNCAGNNLSELNVSNNSELEELNCYGNNIAFLDVSKNSALRILSCGSNLITTLDVSSNTALTKLSCGSNPITTLDVSKNADLRELSCGGTAITAIDVSKNTALSVLSCGGTAITSLDVSNNEALTELGCYRTQLTAIDVSKNTALRELSCSDNKISALDLSNNKLLTRLYAYSCELLSLDLSGNLRLELLYCHENHLSELDLSNHTKLRGAVASGPSGVAGDTIYRNQTRNGLKARYSDGKYSVNLNDYVSDITRIDPESVKDTEGASCSYDKDTGIATFTALENLRGIRYDYDTAYTKLEKDEAGYRYMDVTITRDGGIFTIDSIPEGVFGEEYEFTLTSGTSGAIEWVLTGELPDGLSFSNGKISGKPQEAGSFTFTVRALLDGIIEDEKTFTLTVIAIGVKIDAENFPDYEFREYVSRNFDSNNDGWLDDNEVYEARSIVFTYENDYSASNRDASLKGIEFFTELRELDCVFYSPYLNEIDISKNTKLVSLDSMGLSSLDVTNNTELVSLTFSSGKYLKSIDLSNNGKLRYLKCSGGSLESLDVSGNSALEYLDCSRNRITELKIGDNPALQYLACASNKLTSLNVGNKPAMTSLICSFNNITDLDVSNLPMIEELACNSNDLISLDVSNNPALVRLICSFNHLSALDVSKNMMLAELECQYNELSDLDVSSNTELEALTCLENKISALDLSNNKALTYLSCSRNDLTVLDLSNNASLDVLHCDRNHLSRLDLRSNDIRVGDYKYQSVRPLKAAKVNAGYLVSLSDYLSSDDLERVTADSYSFARYSSRNHTFTCPSKPQRVSYFYDTRDGSDRTMSVSIVQDDSPEIIAQNLETAKESQRYSAVIEAFGSGAISFDIVSGDIPEGLSLDVEGKISGTPTKPGLFTFTVRARNDFGEDSKTFTLNVIGLPRIITEELPDGNLGVPYSATLMAEGNVSWKAQNGFISGLRLRTSGEISGTPTVARTFTVTVVAENEAGRTSRTFTVTINGKKNLRITPNSLPKAKWGKKYSKTFKVSGLKSPLWTVSGDLPDGLSLNSSIGRISGTVTGVGTFNFTVTARNGTVISKDYSLTVKGIKPKLKGSLPKGIVGTEYYAELRATGTTPMTWSIPRLPEGLVLTVSDDGKLCIISGTPTEGNKRKVSVNLTNAAGSIKKNLALKLNFTKPKITTLVLPAGRKGTAYSAKFKASGSPAITWRKSSGKLPKGITLYEDGTLSGTPEEAGDFTFKVQAKNGGGKDSARFILNVSETQHDEQNTDYGHDSTQGTVVCTHTLSQGAVGVEPDAYGDVYVTAALLGEIEVDEEGMYEFEVVLSDDVPDGLLVWRETPDAENDTENAIFLDDDGEIIHSVPESRSVTVSAWLEPGRVYEPAIIVKVSR